MRTFPQWTMRAGCLTVLGGARAGRSVCRGANPGTDSQFPANRAENRCQSRVCGVSRPTAPKTVKHPCRRRRSRYVYNYLQGYTSVRTNIVIDDKLMRDTLRATGLKTKREAVEEALRTLLRLRRQAGIRRLRGKLDWQGDLNAMRSDS